MNKIVFIICTLIYSCGLCATGEGLDGVGFFSNYSISAEEIVLKMSGKGVFLFRDSVGNARDTIPLEVIRSRNTHPISVYEYHLSIQIIPIIESASTMWVFCNGSNFHGKRSRVYSAVRVDAFGSKSIPSQEEIYEALLPLKEKYPYGWGFAHFERSDIIKNTNSQKDDLSVPEGKKEKKSPNIESKKSTQPVNTRSESLFSSYKYHLGIAVAVLVVIIFILWKKRNRATIRGRD